MIQQPSARQTLINTLVVLGVLFVAWFVIQIRSTLVLLLFGILFAASIEPLVNRLRKRGFRRGQAILLVYLSLLALLSLVIFFAAPSLFSQGSQLLNDIPTILQDLRADARASESAFVRETGTRVVNEALIAYNQARASPPIQGQQAFKFASSIAGGLFAVITVLVVAFYWMTEKAIIKRLYLGLFAIERRDRAHKLWDDIEGRIGGWTRGQLLLCVTIGAISTVAYGIIGVDFWLALGLIAGITEIIPLVGPILGGAVAAVVALTDSWQKALIVVIFAIALQQLESVFLVPRVMKNAVGMTPLTVVLAVLIGSSLAGVLGAVLAIPVGAAVQVLVSELLYNRADDPDNRSVRPGKPRPADSGHDLAGESVGEGGRVPLMSSPGDS